MPLFFLHRRRNGELIEDPDGSHLPHLEAARDEALAAARDLWALAMSNGDDLADDQFMIANERGDHVLIVAFVDALPEGLQRRLVLR